MTTLGLFFAKKFINRAELSRKTGITENRLNALALKENSNLRAKELYLIALALEMQPNELHEVLFKDVKLP